MMYDTEYYEEVKTDPTSHYRESVDRTVEDLKERQLITDFEQEVLHKGTRTPLFYGLPKIHKVFEHTYSSTKTYLQWLQ